MRVSPVRLWPGPPSSAPRGRRMQMPSAGIAGLPSWPNGHHRVCSARAAAALPSRSEASVTDPAPPTLPFVRAVLHPTDFSPASEAAFAHALAIALVRETKLWILHAGR